MKIIQIIYGDIPPLVSECMASVKSVYPDVEVLKFSAVDNPVHQGDIYRYNMLMEHDDILYIDWDVLLTGELFIVKDGIPCCNYYKGQPDYSIIYSPNKEFWIELEKERLSRGISLNSYGFIRKLLKGKNINEIIGGFTHFRGNEKWQKITR